jgi:ligand-binding SRPBCC domain-containing protein
MGSYVNRSQWFVNATPEQAFALVSVLTRSHEWATNPLTVVAETPGPVKVGSKYHSEAKFMGSDVHGEQEVTAYDPPARFSFVNVEHGGKEKYTHDFTVRAEGGKTIVERTITFEVPGFRGMAIKFVVPFLSRKFDRQASEKLDALFPAVTA